MFVIDANILVLMNYVFNLQVLESGNVEPANMEDWLYKFQHKAGAKVKYICISNCFPATYGLILNK